MIATNAVKGAAASGEWVRGLHLTFPSTAAIEVLASERLGFVYLDGEHGCFDWRDIEMMCITAERHHLTPIARIPDPSAATITRFLDRGEEHPVVLWRQEVEVVAPRFSNGLKPLVQVLEVLLRIAELGLVAVVVVAIGLDLDHQHDVATRQLEEEVGVEVLGLGMGGGMHRRLE